MYSARGFTNVARINSPDPHHHFMSTTTETITSLRGLFIEQLSDLYDAEQRIIAALPEKIGKAHNEDLKKGLSEHLEETRAQLERLTEIGETLGENITGETCEATRGLITEAQETIGQVQEPNVRDAAIIASAQRIEHYEIAAYGTAIEFAEALDVDSSVTQKLKETLNEEKSADAKLTKIATGGLFSKGVNDKSKA